MHHLDLAAAHAEMLDGGIVTYSGPGQISPPPEATDPHDHPVPAGHRRRPAIRPLRPRRSDATRSRRARRRSIDRRALRRHGLPLHAIS